MLTVALSQTHPPPPPTPPLSPPQRLPLGIPVKIAIPLPPSDRSSRAFGLSTRQLSCDKKRPLRRRGSVTVVKINVLFQLNKLPAVIVVKEDLWK